MTQRADCQQKCNDTRLPQLPFDQILRSRHATQSRTRARLRLLTHTFARHERYAWHVSIRSWCRRAVTRRWRRSASGHRRASIHQLLGVVENVETRYVRRRERRGCARDVPRAAAFVRRRPCTCDAWRRTSSAKRLITRASDEI